MTNTVHHLEGIAAISITPFDADLAVDRSELNRIVRLMDEGGADSIFACGGLAEYYSLSATEKRSIIQETVAAARRAPVFATVGLGVENAVLEAQAAEQDGVAGIMLLPPPHPYVHPTGLVDYYREICGATSLGVVAYIRDGRLSAADLAPLISIDNVIAVKYAVNDVRKFASIVDDLHGRGDVSWLCGTAEAWAPFFHAAGATGFTSGIANLAVSESVRLRDALQEGDRERARDVWSRLRPVEDMRAMADEVNSIAVIKAATTLCGLTASAAVRPPLRPLDSELRASLELVLDGWDVTRVGADADH